MKEISEDERKYLEAAIELLEREGIPPTFDEIAKAVDRTRRAAIVQFEKLRYAGYARWDEDKRRSLQILKRPDGRPYFPPPTDSGLIALEGTVPAGKPQLVVDEPGTIITTTDHRHLRVVILDHDDDARHAKRGDRVFVEDVEPESDRDWVVDGGVVRELRRPKV